MALRVSVVGIEIARQEIRRRIGLRLRARLEEGMVEEVQGLLDRGLSPGRLAELGLEYREVAAYLLGRKSREEMISDLENAIGRFAKRQQTWFRGMERRGTPIRWIEADDVDSVINARSSSR
jgi:tRNA dimethylallyltransferase